MTEENNTTPMSGKLLDEEQQIVLQNIAKLGKDRTKGRALALLSLDKGATRAEAGEVSGLSLGQIKYVLATFRQRGLAMFARYSFVEPQTSTEEEVPTKTVAKQVTKPAKKKKTKKDQPKKKGKKMAKKGKKPKKDKKVKGKAKGKKKGKKDKKGKKKGKKK